MTCPRCYHDPNDLVAFVHVLEKIYRECLHPDPEEAAFPAVEDDAYRKGAADALEQMRVYAEANVVGETLV